MAALAYVRVSTDNKSQTTENQILDIERANFKIDKIYAEEISGATKSSDRPEFAKMLLEAEEGDVIICTTLSRIGRNTEDVIARVKDLEKRKIKVVIIQFGGVDLTSATGKLILTVMAGVAEFERENLAANTRSGLRRTKANGTILGPPLTIPPYALKEMAYLKSGLKVKAMSLNTLVHHFGNVYSRSSIAKNLAHWGNKLDEYDEQYKLRAKQYKTKKMKVM